MKKKSPKEKNISIEEKTGGVRLSLRFQIRHTTLSHNSDVRIRECPGNPKQQPIG